MLKRAQGGSYVNGMYGSYDGGRLVNATNTILVVANYRVGIAGFFVSSATASQGGKGNYVSFFSILFVLDRYYNV